MTELEKTRWEIVRFLRGSYRLDEVAGLFYQTPCVKFRQGKKTIVSINLHEDCFVFQIILGKAEREAFEQIMHEFPIFLQELYQREPTHYDGKWLLIPVKTREDWAPVKRLILMKKKPNRKPFPTEGAINGKCGHRCDLCVHFTGITEEFRQMLLPHLNAVYGEADWAMRCSGCATPGCQCYAEGAELCEPLQCLKAKALECCPDCSSYPCQQSTVGYRGLEHRSLSADDITWGVLPYIPQP